jgi:hypothetical protein
VIATEEEVMDVPHDVMRQRLEQKVREAYARARKAEAGSWWGAVDQRIVDHQITQDEAIGSVIEELRTEMREELQQALDSLRAEVKELKAQIARLEARSKHDG